MKLSITTLGCPQWTLIEIVKNCSKYGLHGVDFRGLGNEIDVTRLPEFTHQIASTRRKFADAGLEVSGIGSSIRICVEDKLNDNIEEARRTIDVAYSLDCKYVRVFGGGDSSRETREVLAGIGRGTMERILELDGAKGINWSFETHDEWIKTDHCRLLLENINHSSFGALWDVGHTARVGGETPDFTYKTLGERTSYVHIKDAILDPSHTHAMKDGWRYVTPGTGSLPLKQAIDVLRNNNYNGWIVFEHEKRWHAELDEPEVIFPKFVDWIQRLYKLGI